jgi:PAS domain S-box-containing protein
MTRETKKASRAARKDRRPGAPARAHPAAPRKQASKRPRGSDLHYRDLLEASSDWIWELDANLRFSYFTPTVKERHGFDPAQVLGRTREELGANSDSESFRRHLEDLRAHRPFRDFVYRSATLGGRWFRISGTPVHDAKGRFAGYLGIGADITSEIEAHRRVAELQARFHEAIEAVDGGFALWDAEDRLVACNAGYATAYPQIADLLRPGVAFSALLRKAAERGMYRAPASELEAFMADRIATHRNPGGPVEQQLADGRWIQIKERRAEGGGILSAWTDITAIKRREEALRASEERFALAAHGVNDGIWDWDLRENRVFRSERLREMLGSDKGDQINANSWWLTQLHPDDIAGYKAALRTHFKTGDELFVCEYRARHASGTYLSLLDRAVSRRDADGRVVRMVGSVTDITERKRMEAKLREANEAIGEKNRQLNIALDNMSQGLTLFDAQERLIIANRQYQEMYSLDDRLITPGATLSDLVALAVSRGNYEREIAAAAIATRRTAVATGERQHVRQQQSDGRLFEVIHQPLSGGGIVSTFADITGQEARERALRSARETAEAASRAKSAFLAHMSHELRTPLNAIIGFSELIKGEMLGPIGSPRYKEYAGDIHSSGKHLLQLINDVLDISKIEAGKAELYEETVDLSETIQHCAALIQPQAASASLKVAIDVASDLPCLRGDARAVKQVLLNLLSNSVKFTPAGGAVRLSARLGEKGDLALAVSDTGVGMSPADAARVFEPFYQVQSERSRSHEGTGLGLSLVKGLVEMHGGAVTVQSALKHGTTITVTLPAARVLARVGDRGAA